jgi:hypothetical protein
MKAIGLTEFGGPEVLEIVDLPEPEPGPGELRIRVHAVGVNPTNITFRTGGRAAQLVERPKPYVPGMDVAEADPEKWVCGVPGSNELIGDGPGGIDRDSEANPLRLHTWLGLPGDQCVLMPITWPWRFVSGRQNCQG